MSKAKIFFIGVGNMGRPMAMNLLKAGHALTVHDVHPDKAEPLLAQTDLGLQHALRATELLGGLHGPRQVAAVQLGGGVPFGIAQMLRQTPGLGQSHVVE